MKGLLAFCLSCLLPITAAAATRTWTGAVSNLWSVSGNWTGGTPASGDQLVFPDGASNRATSNDLSGLVVASINFSGTLSDYSASGNAITITSGITTACCRPVTWSIPITLIGSQTFGGSGVTFAGPIDLNGFSLTIMPKNTVLSGSLTGSGMFTLGNGTAGGMRLTGTSTFSGTFTQYAVLDVTGSISNATMNGSSILSGAGTMPALTFEGIARPGPDLDVNDGGSDPHTTGILSTGSLTLNHLHNPSLAIDIRGITPGTEYDRVAVTGTVTLNSSPTLEVTILGTPSPGQQFIIISNDGADPVSGTFSGLPEGATVPGVGYSPTITYAGGDGNDVALIIPGVSPKSWTGAVNNLWSVGGNWTDGVPPADGDELTFPSFAANRSMTNDLTGLDLASFHFKGGGYSVSGNAITLSGGMTTWYNPVTWSIPITLTASQTFDARDMTFAGSIDLNGHALTMLPSSTLLSGSLIGSGSFTNGNGTYGGMRLTGTSTFSGTFTNYAFLDVTGSISNSTMNGSSILTGTGTIPALTFQGIIQPGVDLSFGSSSSAPHTIGILSTGSLTLNHFHDPSLAIDIKGLTPGMSYDQLAVNGTVTLNSNPTLQVTLSGTPPPGQQFIIISNDGADPVSGTFSGLAEGAAVPDTSFTITYAGGDGNDVVLIMPGLPSSKVWTGAVNHLWSVGGNWSGGVAPVDGDRLLFPDFASNRDMTNDLTGLDLASISFSTTDSYYIASGNAITLADGITNGCCYSVMWSIPITLTGSQTFGNQLIFSGPINLNGHALTIQSRWFYGSLTGSGALTLSGGGMHLIDTSTSTFSGTFTVHANLNVTGSISNSTMNGSSILSGTGTIPALTFEGIIRPGEDPTVGGDLNMTGILSTGSLILNHLRDPSLEIDIKGTTPGTGYDQLAVTGTVTLNNPTLRVHVSGPAPSSGQTCIIIANDGTDPVNGTFAGLPEGGVVYTGANTFRISYIGGTGNDVVLTALTATTTVLTVSPTPVVTGQPFGVSATVSSSSGTPTGTVQFKESATALAVFASATLNGSGVASANISLPAGTHSIVAVYVGAGLLSPSGSTPGSKSVTKGNSSTTLTVIVPATIAHGDSLSVQVEVAAAAPATGTPTGMVTVSADGQTDGGSLTGGGVVTGGLPSLTPGIHTVTASYGGDANFLSSSASTDIEVFARIASEDAQTSEGTTANVVVTLSGASNQTVTVDYTTVNGTANAGSDYAATSGTLEFAPGVTSQTIAVMINSDGVQEPRESIRVVFSNPQHAVLDESEAEITVADALAAGVPTLSTIGLLLFGLAIAAAGMFAMRS